MPAVRRLAAILAADVAGYSRLMGADEEGTLSRLKALRAEVIDPKIAEHRCGGEFCFGLREHGPQRDRDRKGGATKKRERQSYSTLTLKVW